jgi:outer membrane lipoprotein LolB
MMRTLFCFMVACLLTACATTLVPHADDAMLASADDPPFSAHGRFSAHTEQDAFSAAFDWQHSAARDRIALSSPLGAMLAQLVREGKTIQVFLEDDGQAHWQGTDWQTLAQQSLGFPLPVDGLVYWLRGRAIPEEPSSTTLDAAGRIEQLRQDGWQIDYRYASAEAKLPQQLNARYGDAVSLRVRIDGWEAGGQ